MWPRSHGIALNRCPLAVNDPERGVAVLDVLGQDPHRHQIIDVVEWPVCVDLPMDRPQVLGSATHRSLDLGSLGASSEGAASRGSDALGLDGAVGPAQASYSSGSRNLKARSSSSQRIAAYPNRCASGVDLARLERNAALLVLGEVLESPHVVNAVGQLDQDHPGIVRHGEEHFSIILDLLLRGRSELDLSELRDSVDNGGDLGAELLLDIAHRDVGVLDGVVDQTCYDRVRIQAQLRQDRSDLDGMRDVLLTRRPGLTLVGPDRQLVRSLDRVDVEAIGVALERPGGGGGGRGWWWWSKGVAARGGGAIRQPSPIPRRDGARSMGGGTGRNAAMPVVQPRRESVRVYAIAREGCQWPGVSGVRDAELLPTAEAIRTRTCRVRRTKSETR